MPNLFSERLERARKTVSRLGRRSKDHTAPESSSEASAGGALTGTTGSNGSTESLATVGPTATPLELNQGGPSIWHSEPETTFHTEAPETLPTDSYPSAEGLSASSGAATPGASQIKIDQVQDDAFQPLRDLLHKMRIFQKTSDTSDDTKEQQLREDFIVQIQRHYTGTHLSRAERPRFTKSPYEIQLRDLVSQEIVIGGFARTNNTIFGLRIRNQVKSTSDNVYYNLTQAVDRLQEQALRADLLNASPVTILETLGDTYKGRGDQVETAISHDERSAWLIRIPKESRGNENPTYFGYGLIEGGEVAFSTS